MSQPKFYSPLKIGLLLVSLSYFLFTFHALFTLSWIGEWEPLGGSWGFIIFVEDISATVGLVFRFMASLTALLGVALYFVKRGLPGQTTRKILRFILATEAIYWLTLLVSGVMPLLFLGNYGGRSLLSILTSVFLGEVPCLVESIAIPLALFKLILELSPKKPAKGAIKWGLITGTVYVFVFWLVNSSIWLTVVTSQTAYYTGAESGVLYPYVGIDYLLMYTDHLLSFGYTTVGLVVIALCTAYFTKKSLGTEDWKELDLRRIGAIITAVGLYFLLFYVMWLVTGTNNQLVLIDSVPQVLDVKWSSWYAWFLGHNMDLWLLSLPLVGLPLLLTKETS